MTTINVGNTSALYKEDEDYMVNILSKELPLPWEEVGSSVKVAHSEKEGYSSIFVNKFCHDHNNDKPIATIHPSIKTLPDMFSICLKLYPNNDCLGERMYDKAKKTYANHFSFESYTRTAERFTLIGSGIFKLLEENPFRTELHNVADFVLTIYSRNRRSWVLTDLACQHYAITNTCLYDTLGPNTSSYILGLTESPIIVCAKEKLDILLKIKKDDGLPSLISVVSIDDLDEEDDHYFSLFNELGMQLVDLAYVEKLGYENPLPHIPPTPETLYTLSFTSGTTGPPKGVEIPHSMALAAMTFGASSLRRTSNGSQGYLLSFLPLAHIYERMNCLTALACGSGMGFPHDGLPSALVENLKILKPSILSCVPRVYSKMEGVIKAKLQDNTMLMTVAASAIKRKEELQSAKDNASSGMFLRDRLILRKFEEALGFENIEYVVSGSAPMSDETARFLKLALNCGFSQGYGLTESFAGCALSYPFEKDPGSSGPICITCQMRLRDIPEMNYYSRNPHENPKGELLLRGYQIFKGYYKNPKLTKELIDEDGWFHTGDVASIDEKGRVSIIDRVKNFFKLAQGEYITPERIENIYLSQSPLLSQLYVHGDSFKNYLVCIAGIDVPNLKRMIKDNKMGLNLLRMRDDELLATFNGDLNLKRFILKNLNENVKDAGLQGFEKLHNIHLAIDPLKVEDDVVTPTLKIKRNIARKFFEDIFVRLYEEGSLIRDNKL